MRACDLILARFATQMRKAQLARRSTNRGASIFMSFRFCFPANGVAGMALATHLRHFPARNTPKILGECARPRGDLTLAPRRTAEGRRGMTDRRH